MSNASSGYRFGAMVKLEEVKIVLDDYWSDRYSRPFHVKKDRCYFEVFIVRLFSSKECSLKYHVYVTMCAQQTEYLSFCNMTDLFLYKR